MLLCLNLDIMQSICKYSTMCWSILNSVLCDVYTMAIHTVQSTMYINVYTYLGIL